MSQKQNNNWQKVFIRRDSDVPTICGMILTAYKYIWQYKKDKKEYLFGYSKDGHYHYFSQNLDRWAFGRSLYEKHFFSPADILHFYRKGLKFLKQTEIKTASWQEKLKNHPNDKTLLAAYKDFRDDFTFVNDNYSIMPWWAMEAWQHDFEQIFSRLVKKHHLEPRYDQLLQSATHSWKETAISHIRLDYKQGLSVPELVHQYQFLRSWTAIWHKPIDAAWIKTALQHKSSKGKILSHGAILSLLRPSTQEKQFFAAAPYMVFFKDWRDDLRRRHSFSWQFLWDAIGKRFGISAVEVGYFTLSELERILKSGKLDRKVLQERKTKPFLILIDGKKLDIKILTGKFPKAYQNVIKNDRQSLSQQTVTGIIGQPGIIKGRVAIIAGVKDLGKVKKGDILIANTTHPNYLPAMRIAAGFVTDEGGITSHAAIVARELKLPCLVGTKIATKVFKDGDLVQIDANNGTVKKL